MSLPNIHGTALILGDRGVLITGPSGSGKTTLALTLLQQAQSRGVYAALIGDDQVLAEAMSARLIVHASPAIAGLAEVYGLGPRPLQWRLSGQIDLLVELVAAGEAARLQEIAQREIAGVPLSAISLPTRKSLQSALVLSSWLSWQPFAA